ncbi:hypothetical protein DYB28_006530 [Aphanomyces astaci]|uniref:Uncharacterized protein n=1 Tax=Aphanomyces astaci TaxID=112090 RepID=A0A9X8DWM0_APHAT|nr:hypothetical protein DYB28_006530 [Aphanomyces astaci]
MGPKKGNTNTKVEAANQRKAAQAADKKSKKSAQEEANAAADWAQGADGRSAKRAQEEELKRQQADAKKAELKRLQDEEEAAMSGIKAKAKSKAQKDIDKPWEAALAPVAKKSNKGSRAPPPAPKVVAAPAPARPASRNDIVFDERSDDDLFQNRNRLQTDALEGLFGHGLSIRVVLTMGTVATTIEGALDMLGVNDKDPERHPERRMKAVHSSTSEFGRILSHA